MISKSHITSRKLPYVKVFLKLYGFSFAYNTLGGDMLFLLGGDSRVRKECVIFENCVKVFSSTMVFLDGWFYGVMCFLGGLYSLFGMFIL